MAQATTHAVGKRKTSIARVWLKPGKGDVVINKRELGDYMLRPTARMIINQPFELTGTAGKYDVIVNVIGGGLSYFAVEDNFRFLFELFLLTVIIGFLRFRELEIFD
jgi:ribosomal protein S9